MLKISEGRKNGQIVGLWLEGRVVGPWVAELLRVCDRLLAEGSKVSLNLADVIFADENGLALLASLKRRGVKLLNATPFLEEQLKSGCY